MSHTMARMTRSAPGPAQGTMGGPAPSIGPRPGKRVPVMGDEVYLWILVAAEVATIAFFRASFARYHGG